MEHLRTYTRYGFRLDLWDTFVVNSLGKSVLHYALFDETLPEGRGIIFEGGDFCPGAGMLIDGDQAVAGLLGFLSLGEGDTDSEYFQGYTDRQLAWRDSDRREILALIARDLEEGDEAETF